MAMPYKSIWFGDIRGPKPYKLMWFGGIDDSGPSEVERYKIRLEIVRYEFGSRRVGCAPQCGHRPPGGEASGP